ncbi:MAG: cell division protein FtsZ, partial [Saprospiraceae bacterium]|nr:cell division protein FtsZ [Saprospiraceae bacterium]
AELQMDELTEITDVISNMSGEDAEVIFGHGVDANLGNSIGVTVIATGFDLDTDQGAISNEDSKTVFDLETNKQIGIFGEKKTNQSLEDMDLVPVPVPVDGGIPVEGQPPVDEEFERGHIFDFTEENVTQSSEDDNGLFSFENDGLEIEESDSDMGHLDDSGMVSFKAKRDELRKKADERVEKLKGLKGHELTDGELKEKLDVPAYLRKKVSLKNVPHSSERNISKFNLNDDNQILGNNKFLHDNVD